MRRCEDEKRERERESRPPLLEEPFAQTLSGKKHPKKNQKLSQYRFQQGCNTVPAKFKPDFQPYNPAH